MGDPIRTSARTTGRAAATLFLAISIAAALNLAVAKPAAAAPCDVVQMRIGSGSETDWGWRGDGHDQAIPAGGALPLGVVHRCSVADTVCTLDTDCPSGETCDPTCDCDNPVADPECELFGPVDAKRCVVATEQQCQVDADCPNPQPCREFFAPPLPLSAGGTPTCIAGYFQDDLTGTLDLQSGRVETAASLRWRVYLGIATDQPCPRCGALAQNPQVGGTFACDGGPRDGATCTVDMVSPLFGGTSYDCPPSPAANVSGAGLAINFDRLTTESQTMQATLPCGGVAGSLHPSGGNAVCLDTLTACTTNADCLRCTAAPTVACTSNVDCTGNGVCAAAPEQPVACGVYCHCGFCDGDPTSPCSSDAQCDLGETCEQGSAPWRQELSNACDDLICGLGGLEQCCAAGDPGCFNPTDEVGTCTLASYVPCAGNTDCASQSAGDCVFAKRSCFEGVIARSGSSSALDSRCLSDPGAPSCTSNGDCASGTCAPYTMLPTLDALFCAPGTASAGVNYSTGTPGPATLSLVTTMSLDGTGAACLCGNGNVDCVEHCDDGNAVDGDGCDSNCTATGCGNGIPTAGEICDDGNAVNGDGCDGNCTISACGNGAIAPFTNETCDDGNLVDGDGCDSNCTITACGNGVLTTGEDCDDGNVLSGDGCSATCQIEVVHPCLAVPSCIGLGANGRASLSIANSETPAKDKLKWKWTNGEETTPDDIGDPTMTVAYTLCLIDSGNVAASYDVAPSDTLWSLGSRDTKYRDRPGSQAGITSIKLRAGSDGRARIGVQAGGANLASPAPFAPGQMFHQAPSVTVRLINSLGSCWESDFELLDATRNSEERFEARLP